MLEVLRQFYVWTNSFWLDLEKSIRRGPKWQNKLEGDVSVTKQFNVSIVKLLKVDFQC